jgi:F-type H+-transporting ATPase subunit a
MKIYTSPLEQFEVTSWFGLDAPLLGFNLSLTILGFYILVVLFIYWCAMLLYLMIRKIVPSRWSIGLESSYASLHGMVKKHIGSANEVYFILFYLYYKIYSIKILSLLPYKLKN